LKTIGELLASYAAEASALANSPTTSEESYYPALQALLNGLLRLEDLPFEARSSLLQKRSEGGTDKPDFALFDGAGDFPVVLGEVKKPGAEVDELALSTAGNDQIGRYLAQTGVVLLTNVRAFGLLSHDGRGATGPVPPAQRRLLDTVELWSSAGALASGQPAAGDAGPRLAAMIETAVTEFAPIAEPESLARILARQARRAKAALPARFSQAVQPLLDDFAKALGLHFEGSEGEEFLRSSLIQTAFYGLFAGWTLWRHSGSEREFRWEDLAEYLKIPFLGGLFHEFRHPLRLRELGLARYLDRATETLARVDAARFFARFQAPSVFNGEGGVSTAESAILYFYEPFLEAFDPDLRRELGVWYTPREIVRYQVRKVDQLLRTELGCPRGFADDRVVVLDPCCGTGAYLIEVLRAIAEELRAEGAGAMLGSKLLDSFCRRLIGFEILTAPFVVAQLQLYLLLSELGVEPDEGHRPAIYLTNALSGWEGPVQLALQFPELQQEHEAARRVKREEQILVVLGNPPYNRFAGVPLEEEATLVDHYKGIRRGADGKPLGASELYRRFGIRKQLLDDLYLRFFRLAEIRIGERAEFGVVSFISNSSYLAGRSHPVMRESLLSQFDEIWIDDLHGNRIASERTPWGDSCETIFSSKEAGPGIKVGTAISTFLKRPVPRERAARIHFRDFWGRSLAKRKALLASLEMSTWTAEERQRAAERPEGPRDYRNHQPSVTGHWRFIPTRLVGGYEDWPGVDELFPAAFQGVNPNRGIEGSVIDQDRKRLSDRMRRYFSAETDGEFERAFPELMKPRAGYDPGKVRQALLKRSQFATEKIQRYLLFPLDSRFLYYEAEDRLLNRSRPELWDNLAGNSFLLTVPQARRTSEAKPLLARTLFDLHAQERGAVGFPLRVRAAAPTPNLFSPDGEAPHSPRANLAPEAWRALSSAWGLTGDLTGEPAALLVADLFHLALALGHSARYQADHQDALAQDWLHLPIPRHLAELRALAALGERVAQLLDPLVDPTLVLRERLGPHLATLAVPTSATGKALREADLTVTISHFGAAPGGWRERSLRPGESLTMSWGTGTGDLHLNSAVYLAHVPAAVWRYELGGYPVVKKWLGYRDAGRRPGRPLTAGELDQLRNIVHRLAALLTLGQDLDQAYERALASPFTAEELGLR
jgi:Type ISP C-terminal specificity domain/N-6 DNA Methylase